MHDSDTASSWTLGMISALRRRYKMIATLVITSTALALLATLYVPKQYRARMVLSIYARYFQNPLIRDFVPELFDTQELRAQRESLIRLSMNQEFLDDMAAKYNIYKTAETDPGRTLERQELLKKFEIISLNQNTYQISFKANSPDIAFEISQSLLERIQRVFFEQRHNMMQNLRTSIRKELRVLGLSLQKNSDPLASLNADALAQELERINLRTESLKTQFTDMHPDVLDLKRRAALIQSWLDKIREKRAARSGLTMTANPKPEPARPGTAPAEVEPEVSAAGDFALMGDEPADARLEVYRDLFRKYVYLTISMHLDQAQGSPNFGILEAPSFPGVPFAPSRVHFAVVGLLVGLLLSSIVLLSEPKPLPRMFPKPPPHQKAPSPPLPKAPMPVPPSLNPPKEISLV